MLLLFLGFISYAQSCDRVDHILVLELERRLQVHNSVIFDSITQTMQENIATLPHIPNYSMGYSLKNCVTSMCNHWSNEAIQTYLLLSSRNYLDYFHTYYQFNSLVESKKGSAHQMLQ